MAAQDCALIIGAISAAQIAMLTALGALWVRVRENGRLIEAITSQNGSP